MDEPRSPTVWQAYAENPDWWAGNGGGANAPELSAFDFDGFDADGFDVRGVDRIGNPRDSYRTSVKGALKRTVAAKAFGSRFAEWLSLRVPAVKSKAITDGAQRIIEEAFRSEKVDIRNGFNSTGSRYVGAYLDRAEGYFAVIVEKGLRARFADDVWPATVLGILDEESLERRIAAESLEKLMSAVSEELGAYLALPRQHVIYIVDAGTSDARFGALPVSDFVVADGGLPGDEIARLSAKNPVDALKRFRGDAKRSDGFEDMIEQGLLAASGPAPR